MSTKTRNVSVFPSPHSTLETGRCLDNWARLHDLLKRKLQHTETPLYHKRTCQDVLARAEK